MKIAIVNDMTSALAALRRVLQAVPDCQVVWTARDGAEAVAKCHREPPDLILMDLLMPVMDGVEATQHIMKCYPCAILIVTACTETNMSQVYEALGYGALDAVDTPVLGADGSAEMASKLLAKIARIRKLLKPAPTGSKGKFASRYAKLERRYEPSFTLPLVAIGSSTGGPKALAAILSQLPAGFGAALVIVQHVGGHFSSGFIEWLAQQTALPVRLATAGDRLRKGTVLVAGTNDHLYLKPDLTFGYTKNPVSYPYRPSVDVFFKSLAENWKGKGTAILLTGMGRDGALGLRALRLQGWHTIAQNKESCTIYGMPKAAVELDAAVEVLSLEAIATTLLEKLT